MIKEWQNRCLMGLASFNIQPENIDSWKKERKGNKGETSSPQKMRMGVFRKEIEKGRE